MLLKTFEMQFRSSESNICSIESSAMNCITAESTFASNVSRNSNLNLNSYSKSEQMFINHIKSESFRVIESDSDPE